jgi:nitric oxide reductase NorD protein
MDVSLSADGWIGDRRVLDAVQDAALLLGEVTDRLNDAFRLQAFASQTRNYNRVWTLKDWSDAWPSARNRLGALRTQGYTRIGPALRHASSGLAKHSARRRLLLLLTDGKPTDFDRYEGGYGRADVRQAVREAAQAGVQVHAIGFDPSVASQLGEMFGSGGWAAVNGPAALSEAVLEAYGRFAV